MESPEWTPEDRALLLALQEYERTLCPGCGHPKRYAWHAEMNELYEAEAYVCAACTASARVHNAKAPQVAFTQTYPDPDRPGRLEDLPPLVLGETTIDLETPSAP